MKIIKTWENVTYESCLSKLLKHSNKKALIITKEEMIYHLKKEVR